ncbi:MAG: branched-chain amino acid ABC transporter permease, partial [Niameybacter sp.]
AMGIALYAMFIALIIPGMKKVKAVRIVVLFTILISISLHFVPFLRNLTEGWKIIIITLLGSSASAWLFPIKEEDFT